MIAQRLHALLTALVHHYRIIIATRLLDSDFLERVLASVGSVPATQLTREWRIGLVRRRLNAHDLAIFCWSSPRMGATMGTQCFRRTTMWSSERAEI
jgi:hypothetical protein